MDKIEAKLRKLAAEDDAEFTPFLISDAADDDAFEVPSEGITGSM